MHMKKTIIAALFLAAALLGGCTPSEHPTNPVETQMPIVTVPVETVFETVPQTVPAYSIPVETPCGVLYLPDSWDIPIRTESMLGDPMVISFWAEDVKLYELTFSESADGALGMVKNEDGTIYVGMRIAELENEDNMLLSMQETINELMMQLNLEAVPNVPDETQPQADILIDTPYGGLRFPEKWKDCLMTQQEEGLLDFYAVLPEHDPVLLFTVVFETANGHASGVITAENGAQTDLAIVVHDLELPGDWTDGEIDIVYAMQEDMNYLLNMLTR